MSNGREREARSRVGCKVGDYRLIAFLGTGGTAAVYLAEHETSGQRAALKVSRPGLLEKRTSAARFLREVKTMQRLDLDGCVEILDWGIEEGAAYLAMELIEADDLSAVVLREAPLSQPRAIAIAVAVLDVLVEAHELGVVHRDLKPSNIKLLGESPRVRVKVLDFGLAKLFRNVQDAEETLPETLTRPGSTLGTPHYMAPEQFRRTELDGRADIYSLGVILFQMITGKVPISGKDAIEVLIRLSSEQPPPLRSLRPEADEELEEIVMRCLEKAPEDRWPSSLALRAMLRGVAERLEDEAERASAFRTSSLADPDASTELDESPQVRTEVLQRAPGGQLRHPLPETLDETPPAVTQVLARVPASRPLPKTHADEDEEHTDAKPTALWRRNTTLEDLTMEAPTRLQKVGSSPSKPVTSAQLADSVDMLLATNPSTRRDRWILGMLVLLCILGLSAVWYLTT